MGGDRTLIEDAVRQLLGSAPVGWRWLRAEFEPDGRPPVAVAEVTMSDSAADPGSVPLTVPPEVVGLMADHQRRSAAAGSGWRRVIVECDHTGALSMRTVPEIVGAQSVTRAKRRIRRWLWGLAAAASVALLVVAVRGRDHGNGPTVRPMLVSEAMTDSQAYDAAETTVRAWLHERNARNLANLVALTCKDSEGIVSFEVDEVRNHRPANQQIEVAATGAFERHGPLWTLNTHYTNGVSERFVLEVRDGELRVCRIAAAPVP